MIDEGHLVVRGKNGTQLRRARVEELVLRWLRSRASALRGKEPVEAKEATLELTCVLLMPFCVFAVIDIKSPKFC